MFFNKKRLGEQYIASILLLNQAVSLFFLNGVTIKSAISITRIKNQGIRTRKIIISGNLLYKGKILKYSFSSQIFFVEFHIGEGKTWHLARDREVAKLSLKIPEGSTFTFILESNGRLSMRMKAGQETKLIDMIENLEK